MFYPTTCVRLEYGCPVHVLSGFSRRHAYPRYRAAPEGFAYYQVRIGVCTLLHPSTPTPFNGLFRQAAEVSRPRHRIAARTSN